MSRQGGKSKHVPHKDLPVELVEKRNGRERLRVTHVNQAFTQLQRLLPTIRHRTRRVSKEKILILAIQYIKELRKSLEEQSDDADICPDYLQNNCAQELDQNYRISSPDTLSNYSEASPFFDEGERSHEMCRSEPNGDLIGGEELRMRALEDAVLSHEPIYATVNRVDLGRSSCEVSSGHHTITSDGMAGQAGQALGTSLYNHPSSEDAYVMNYSSVIWPLASHQSWLGSGESPSPSGHIGNPLESHGMEEVLHNQGYSYEINYRYNNYS